MNNLTLTDHSNSYGTTGIVSRCSQPRWCFAWRHARMDRTRADPRVH